MHSRTLPSQRLQRAPISTCCSPDPTSAPSVHQTREIQLGVRVLLVELALKVFGPRRRSGTQRHLQEGVGATSLHVLLVQQVKQQILVALDQSLRINLSMLQLFVSIPLNTFQQSRKCLLLFLAQKCFLTLDDLLDDLVRLFELLLLYLLALQLEHLCLLVPLAEGQLANLVLHLHKGARQLYLGRVLGSNPFVQLLNLKLVLFLEFLETEVSCGFIIAHVVVPSVGKLKELAALSRLDSQKLLLLGLPHVL